MNRSSGLLLLQSTAQKWMSIIEAAYHNTSGGSTSLMDTAIRWNLVTFVRLNVMKRFP